MKKISCLSILFVLMSLPLACVERAFKSPVNPEVVTPTSTPAPANTVIPYLICTVTPTVTPVVVSESESTTVTGTNDTFGTAEGLGSVGTQILFVNGYLGGVSASPDNDYYSFVAGTTGTWTIDLDCYMTPPAPLIYIYDSTQTLVGTYSQSPNWVATFSATSGQTYYIRVFGYGGNSYVVKIFHP